MPSSPYSIMPIPTGLQPFTPANPAAPMQPVQMPGMPQGQPGFMSPANPLYQYTDPSLTTNAVFQQGINAAQPSSGIASAYQSILDNIRKQQDYATAQGSAQAQSLAAKRGLTGSSVEQFGVQSAIEAANRAAQDSTSNVLLQNQQAQDQLRQLQAQLYGQRANSLAGLNSDEVASLRNADYSRQYLQLQQLLGQQGLDVSRANIDANRDIARDEQRNNLMNTGAQLFAPYLLSGLFGAPGGGGTPGFFNGGGRSIFSGLTAGGGAGAVPYTGAGTPASSLFPNGLGAVGTNSPGLFGSGGTLLNTAGTSTIGAGNVLPGLAGYQLGRTLSPASQEGDNASQNIGAGVGGVAGSLFGPAGSFAGATAGSLYGKASNRVQRGIEDKAGQTAGDVAAVTFNPIAGVTKLVDNLKNPKQAVKKVQNVVDKVRGKGSGSDGAETVTPLITETKKYLDDVNKQFQAGNVSAKDYYEVLDKAIPALKQYGSQYTHISQDFNNKMVNAGYDDVIDGYGKQLEAYKKGTPYNYTSSKGQTGKYAALAKGQERYATLFPF